MPDTKKKKCDCKCGREFVIPADAPHKRFASTECRNRWHRHQRELEAAQKAKSKKPSLPEDL